MRRFKIESSKLFDDKQKSFRSFYLKIFRYLYFFGDSFIRNECYLKASLLTFYSLIAIVPLLAIIFSIAKGLGLDEFLHKQILETFHEQQDVLSRAETFAQALLAQLKSQTILGVGVLFLFLSIFGLFENIEKSINAIWNIKKHRSRVRRAINYLTAIVVLPLLFILSTSITIFLNSEILMILKAHAMLQNLSEYFVSFMHFTPYALMCAIFSAIYVFTPNAKIYVKSRIIAGILAGIAFQLWEYVYIYFQVSLSNYDVVYGGFAALPLFVIWMQVNFVIFLTGAVIAAQLENFKFMHRKPQDHRYTKISQKQLIFLVLREVTAHFLRGEKPITTEQISMNLGIPLFAARDALHVLEKVGIVAEIVTGRTLEKYQLIVNPEIFTVTSVSNLLEKNIHLAKETRALHEIKGCFQELENAIEKAGVNYNLRDLAHLK